MNNNNHINKKNKENPKNNFIKKKNIIKPIQKEEEENPEDIFS